MRERVDKVWMATFDLINRMGAEDDHRVQQVLLQRVKHGFAPALAASGEAFPRGHNAAVEAVQNLLCASCDFRVMSAGLKLLRQLAPDGADEAATQLTAAAWMDSRDRECRRT